MTPTGTAVINACKWESYSVSLEISLYNLYTYVSCVSSSNYALLFLKE